MPYSHWHNLLEDDRYSASSTHLRGYLTLTEGLESPVPYNIWSYLSMLAAVAGGRIYIDHGVAGKKKLNLAVVLMGFPAVRKSTAISVMERFSHGLPIQYGPSDTSGQRQGIMSAMLPRWQYDSLQEKDEFDLSVESLDAIAALDTNGILPALANKRIPPASELYFLSKELGRLFASSQGHDLINFFTDAIDGESVYYQIKTQAIRIRNPLINLLGATTPGNLATILPRGAESHGILSRMVFVYADRLSSRQPIPEAWSPEQVRIKDHLLGDIERMLEDIDGPLTLTENAKQTYGDIYGFNPGFNDVRLQAYAGRRSDHLLKVAGVLCLARGAPQQLVTASDIRLAHGLLCLTEALMPRSFLGLDPRPASKVLIGITEFLESQPAHSAKREIVLKQVSHIGESVDIIRWVTDLVQQGKIVEDGSNLKLSDEKELLAASMTRTIFNGANLLDDYAPLRTMKAGK